MATNLELITVVHGLYNATTVDVENVFSDKYDNYKILTRAKGDGNNKEIRMRFRTASGLDTSLSYRITNWQLTSYAVPAEVKYNQSSIIHLTYDSGFGGSYVANIYKPYDASSYTYYQFIGGGEYSTGQIFNKSDGFQKTAQQVTGFQLLYGSGNFHDVTTQVYGVR